jgi:hypothetical protein
LYASKMNKALARTKSTFQLDAPHVPLVVWTAVAGQLTRLGEEMDIFLVSKFEQRGVAWPVACVFTPLFFGPAALLI